MQVEWLTPTPVDPGFPQLTLPALAFRDFWDLKLQHDELLSSFAFNCNLRQCTEGAEDLFLPGARPAVRVVEIVSLIHPARWWGLRTGALVIVVVVVVISPPSVVHPTRCRCA